MRVPLLLPALLLLSGCGSYEYDLTQPAPLAAHIGSDRILKVPDDPLTYRFVTDDNRLVMFIENPTCEPIALVADKSYLVDPHGIGHPIPGQTIAPGTYIKLVLPSLGQQPGSGADSNYVGPVMDYNRYSPPAAEQRDNEYQEQPGYVMVPGNAVYFSWEGQTDVHLTLTFQSGKRTFVRNLTFHRKKVD